jgi:hypothetical protein
MGDGELGKGRGPGGIRTAAIGKASFRKYSLHSCIEPGTQKHET